MSVLYIALPIALLLAGAALTAFLVSLHRGQFDDLQSPPVRMLFDDVPIQANDRSASKPRKMGQ